MRKTTLPLALILTVSLTALQPTFAQAVTWDGDTGGDWSDGSNWIGGDKPDTTEQAVLPSVSDASTRIVTQDTAVGETIDSLRFVQDGATGINRLDLSGNISFTKASREGATSAYQVDLTGGATKDQVVLNLNGHAIRFTGGNPSGSVGGGTIDGTVNFNVAGSAILRTTNSGHNVFNVPGIMNVTADGRFGRDTGSVNNSGNFTVNFESGSELNISNNSTFSIEVADRRGQPRNYTLNNSGQIDLEGGSSLDLAVNSTHGSSSNEMNVTFNNTSNGTMHHGGTVALKPHKNVSELTVFSRIVQDGTWSVSGDNASVRRLTTAQDSSFIAIPEFHLRDGGVLSGSGTSDSMEFTEEVFTDSRMTIKVFAAFSGGTIRPGDGSQGPGLDSVGTLNLRNTNVTFDGNNASLELDLGGIANGEFDRLRLLDGLNDQAGAGTLDLSAGGTLQLWSVAGFDPELLPNFSITLIEAGLVTDPFGVVRLDGDTFTGNSLLLGDGRSLVLDYSTTAVNLSLIPEPQTYAVTLGLLTLALVAISRFKLRANAGEGR